MLIAKFYKYKTTEYHLAYKRQRNVCTSLLKKTKKEYYGTLNPAVITDNKKFWKAVKPYFSDKVLTSDKIILLDKNEICEDENDVAHTFNDFFSTVVKNLGITDSAESLRENVCESDPVNEAIKNMKCIQHL